MNGFLVNQQNYGEHVLTARYSMVYIENEACPEKKDFL